jgi:hypothetical protein
MSKILCSTYKSKRERVQCPNKAQKGMQFCGKHKNITEITFSNGNYEINGNNDTQNIESTNNNYENDTNTINSNDSSTTNTINDLLNIGSNIEPDLEYIPEPFFDENIDCNENINKSLIRSFNKIINKTTKYNIYKTLETNDIYNDYLNTRNAYIKKNTKHIELLEYIENNNIDTYALPRIIESLYYYKLVKINNNESNSSKFIEAFNNTKKLLVFFENLIHANQNLSKLIKLQRFIRKSLILFKDRIRGKALYNRSLCVNDSDFFTLDDLKDIHNDDFVSFSDEKGFIYGYHIDSIIQLILKSDDTYYENFKKKNITIEINAITNNITNTNKLHYNQFIRLLYNHYSKIKIINPYTRFIIDNNIKLNVIRLFAQKEYNLNKPQQINTIVDIKTTVKNKCLSIFQKIDLQGYQTDIYWLYDQPPNIIKVFYKKLSLLWNIEFGLNDLSRFNISKHRNNIFNNIYDIVISRMDKYNLLDKILDTVNIIVSNGVTDADKNSGCIIILYALAFINNNCILANPWLG